MKKGKKYALMLGAIPFITLVFALPFVNRIKPVILGCRFSSSGYCWVAMTPLIFFIAYKVEKKSNPEDEDDKR